MSQQQTEIVQVRSKELNRVLDELNQIRNQFIEEGRSTDGLDELKHRLEKRHAYQKGYLGNLPEDILLKEEPDEEIDDDAF